MYERQCGNCKSRYRVTKMKVPFRDQDSIDCEVCGTNLQRWNGGVVYRWKLIEATVPHHIETHQDSEPEEYLEFLEDMAVAKEAEEEYDRQGLAGTTFYAEYRAKRLGSESTV